MKSLLILLVVCLGFLSLAPAGAQEFPEIYAPVYGNWCGPNHPVSIENAPAPVDQLDSACMRHDYCVAAQGDYNCGCDLAFLTELRSTRWSGPVIQQNARGIYDAIALMPCSSPEGTAQKHAMFAIDQSLDLLLGRGTPMDVLERWRSLFMGPEYR